jgi:hypothetical protein
MLLCRFLGERIIDVWFYWDFAGLLHALRRDDRPVAAGSMKP